MALDAIQEKCFLCGLKTEDLVVHHVSYNPPVTIKVCPLCHKKIHGNLGRYSPLFIEARKYDKVIALKSSLKVWKKCYVKELGEVPEFIGEFIDKLEQERKKILKKMEFLAKEDLSKVKIKGFKGSFLCRLLAYAHPNRFPSLRKFLHYCGYKKSSLVTKRYDRRVHSLVHEATKQVLKKGDKLYYNFYLKLKEDVRRKYPELPNWKVDRKARNILATYLLKEIYFSIKPVDPSRVSARTIEGCYTPGEEPAREMSPAKEGWSIVSRK